MTAAVQGIHGIDRGIDTGHDENTVAQHCHQRFQVPVAVLEAVARTLCDQLHDDERNDRRHDVDEAVHAIEDDGLRSRSEPARHPEDAEADRQRNRKLQRALFCGG
jgi:hypothetical protein